jgi:endoglucanase
MDMLQIKDGKIVDASGQPVWLRGTCVGGWMNMENFINGYPGAEHTLRATFAREIGKDKAQFFFDRLLDYFLTEDDIKFMKASGSTVVRLSFNYRHFERDDRPFEYMEDGFERLDRAVQWCTKHGLYVILDFHAVQGWQSTNWHCDNANRISLIWQFPHFQNRFVALWEELARRYKGNPTIAAYNLMNEPLTDSNFGMFGETRQPQWDIINALYRRTVDAIRAIDPDHIIMLEGDNFSKLFSGLEAPFVPNLGYSSHNYNSAGFGPGAYPGYAEGVYWDAEEQEDLFLRQEGTQYSKQHNVPLWIGEFGSVYNGPAEEVPDRMRALDDYIAIFEAQKVHWTTWTYKDVGVMGWVHLDPESEYMRLIKPMLDAKRRLNTDFWMRWLPDTPAKDMVRTLARYTEEVIGDPAIQHPVNYRFMTQATLAGYVAGQMQAPFARLFKGMSETKIDEVLQAFSFKNCVVHADLMSVIKQHMA